MSPTLSATHPIPRQQPGEFNPYFSRYMDRVPGDDALAAMTTQIEETLALLRPLDEARAMHRYAEGKWSEKEVVGHNLAFDLAMLAPLGFEAGGRPLHDVMVLSRLLTAGGREGNALADLAERHLGLRLDKEEQRGDWSGPALTEAQLAYAAADVLHLDALLGRLGAEIDRAGLGRTAGIERRCLPAWISNVPTAPIT